MRFMMYPILLFYYNEIINLESLHIYTRWMSQRLDKFVQNTYFPLPKTQIRAEPQLCQDETIRVSIYFSNSLRTSAHLQLVRQFPAHEATVGAATARRHD